MKKNIAVELCCVFTIQSRDILLIFHIFQRWQVKSSSAERFRGFLHQALLVGRAASAEPDYQILTCGDNVVHFDNEDEGDEDDEDDVVDHHEDDDDDEDEDDGSECFYNELFLC